MSIQELVLDFVNVKGQELSSKVEENQSIEADLQQINDMWNNVQNLVTERTKELKGMVAELSDFEEDLGRLGDVLNYTEVCLHESETSKEPGYNGLQNQLAKLKVGSLQGETQWYCSLWWCPDNFSLPARRTSTLLHRFSVFLCEPIAFSGNQSEYDCVIPHCAFDFYP